MKWADRGIRVNVVSPGYTATAMTRPAEVAEQRGVGFELLDLPVSG